MREVEEETGLRCHLGSELLPTAYTDARGRAKVVRYWAMSVVGERPFVPGDETDELRWLAVDDASAMLSYDRDLEVVRSFVMPRVERVVAVTIGMMHVLAIATAVVAGAALIAVIVIAWRIRRTQVRRVANITLRLEDSPTARGQQAVGQEHDSARACRRCGGARAW